MKKLFLRKKLFLTVLCSFALLIAGCPGPHHGTPKPPAQNYSASDLLGTWKLMSDTLNGQTADDSSKNITEIFDSSGGTLNNPTESCTETFFWSVTGNALTETTLSGNCSDTTIGESDTLTITISGNNMTAAGPGGSLTFQRQDNGSSNGGAPAAPTGVQATAGDGTIILTWSPVNNATSYNIYWSFTSGVALSPSNELANRTSPAHLTGGNGTTYYFVVTAVNAYGESLASAEVNATPSAGGSTTYSVPAAPTGVHAVAGDSQITLSWTAVTGATSYNIYWSNSAGVTTSTGQVLYNQPNPVILPAANGTTYYAVITAVNANGESTPSAEVSATPSASGSTTYSVPSAPTGVYAVAGDGRVTLSWTQVSGLTYHLYYSTTPGVTKSNALQEYNNQTSPQLMAGLTNGITYYFILTAENSYGESDASAEVHATPLAPVPSAPTAVTATAGANDLTMTISWNTVSDATSYNIYYSTTKGVTKSTGTKQENVTDPAIFTGGTLGIPYYFVVTAANANGESAESAQVCAVPTDGRYVIPCSAF